MKAGTRKPISDTPAFNFPAARWRRVSHVARLGPNQERRNPSNLIRKQERRKFIHPSDVSCFDSQFSPNRPPLARGCSVYLFAASASISAFLICCFSCFSSPPDSSFLTGHFARFSAEMSIL